MLTKDCTGGKVSPLIHGPLHAYQGLPYSSQLVFYKFIGFGGRDFFFFFF